LLGLLLGLSKYAGGLLALWLAKPGATKPCRSERARLLRLSGLAKKASRLSGLLALLGLLVLLILVLTPS
jgi:hypothetical protein